MEYQEISLIKSWSLGLVMGVSSLSTTNKLFSKITMLYITAICFIHAHKHTPHTSTYFTHTNTYIHTNIHHTDINTHTNCESSLSFNFCEQLRHTLKVLLYFLDPLQIKYILESPTFLN